MVQVNLTIKFCGAILVAAYILNLVPFKSGTNTLYELWTGRNLIWRIFTLGVLSDMFTPLFIGMENGT